MDSNLMFARKMISSVPMIKLYGARPFEETGRTKRLCR